MPAYQQVDWPSISEKLPVQKNDEEKQRRIELFKQFDPNGNGYLSLQEVDKGLRDVLCCEELFESKKPMMIAFNAAKNKKGDTPGDGPGQDYITFSEFRWFLASLRRYFEHYIQFQQVDENYDGRIEMKEFIQNQDMISGWVGEEVSEDTFNEIDTNGQRGSYYSNP